MATPAPSAPTPVGAATSVTEDRSAEPSWVSKGPKGLFGAHLYFTVVLWIVLDITWFFGIYDVFLGYYKGLDLLDQTLQAEAEAVVAVIAVIAGAYTLFRYLTPSPKQG